METLSTELGVKVIKKCVPENGCQKIIKFIDECAAKASKQTFQQGRYLEFVTDKDIADWLWDTYLRHAQTEWPQLRKCSPVMPVARYFNLGVSTGVHRERCKEPIQAIIYPNDQYTGGEISFHRDKERELVVIYKPEAGDVVLFPSHVHHCGHESTNGHKYILVTRLHS
jgi:hypothetical protein